MLTIFPVTVALTKSLLPGTVILKPLILAALRMRLLDATQVRADHRDDGSHIVGRKLGQLLADVSVQHAVRRTDLHEVGEIPIDHIPVDQSFTGRLVETVGRSR